MYLEIMEVRAEIAQLLHKYYQCCKEKYGMESSDQNTCIESKKHLHLSTKTVYPTFST